MTWLGCSHKKDLENSKILTRKRRSPRAERKAKRRNLHQRSDFQFN
jgi:hypothetical protein